MTEITLCMNEVCNLRLACGRFDKSKADPEFQSYAVFNDGREDGGECPDYFLRAKLGGEGNEAELPQGRRGRRHNAHAPERTEYRGSEALFGTLFGRKHSSGKAQAQKKVRGGKEEGRPRPPDLMVSRHIHKGRDIKKKDD